MIYENESLCTACSKLTFPSIVPFSRIFLVRDLVSKPDIEKKTSCIQISFVLKSATLIMSFLFKFEHRHWHDFTIQSRDVEFAEPFRKRFYCGPVTIFFRHIPYNKPGNMDFSRLEPFSEPELIFLLCRYPIVPNQGIGQDKYLLTVRRISQRLRISHHSSLKNCNANANIQLCRYTSTQHL